MFPAIAFVFELQRLGVYLFRRLTGLLSRSHTDVAAFFALVVGCGVRFVRLVVLAGRSDDFVHSRLHSLHLFVFVEVAEVLFAVFVEARRRWQVESLWGEDSRLTVACRFVRKYDFVVFPVVDLLCLIFLDLLEEELGLLLDRMLRARTRVCLRGQVQGRSLPNFDVWVHIVAALALGQL